MSRSAPAAVWQAANFLLKRAPRPNSCLLNPALAPTMAALTSRSTVPPFHPGGALPNSHAFATTLRRAHAAATATGPVTPRPEFDALVVGAGPAGLAAVGNLLDNGRKKICWVDDQFAGGRVGQKYREVPSNTRVKRFLSFADGVPAFREISENAQTPNAYTHLQSLDQEGTCQIWEAADLCIMYTNLLDESKGVHKHQGRVNAASWSSQTGQWNIAVTPLGSGVSRSTAISASILVLCQGAEPTSSQLPIQSPEDIHLDLALSPSALSKYLDPASPTVVGCIGASHSAILVLMNLYNLARTTHPHLRIKWFTRHPLRYAEERDGWIFRDNTGLKGTVATWAKANLEPDTLPASDVSQYLSKISTPRDPAGENAIYAAELPACTHVVQAVGYQPNALPTLTRDGVPLPRALDYDQKGAGLKDPSGQLIPALYGAGIAWPERVTDPEGNTERAVGMLKFMHHLHRAVPSWRGA